jgi:hypothetical protein
LYDSIAAVLTFIQTPLFVDQFRRARLNDDDLRSLEHVLLLNPEVGKVLARTGGVRKMRFAPPSRHMGKSGAFRVCYVWFPAYFTIGLFMIYSKNEQDTLTTDDEKTCRLLVQRIQAALSRG